MMLAGCSDKKVSISDKHVNKTVQGKHTVKAEQSSSVHNVINPAMKKVNNKANFKGKLKAIDLKNKLANIRQEIAKQQIFSINNEKITTASGLFFAGKTVHNLNVNQDGVIKGSLVVVLVENTRLTKEIMRLGKVKKIAKDTYQITLAAQQDLFAPYQRLKKIPEVKIVEMEIDYSPVNTHLN